MIVQPICTAPTDGTRILLYGSHETNTGVATDDGGEATLGFCEGYMSDYMGWYNILCYPSHPTHWAPLTPEIIS